MNALQQKDLSDTVSVMETLNDRVRERLRIEKTRIGITEQDMAEQLEWGYSKVTQKLRGRTPITVNEMAAMCEVLHITPLEVVRDPALEFVTEMSPTELRLFHRLSKLSAEKRAAVLLLLSIEAESPMPTPRKRGRKTGR